MNNQLGSSFDPMDDLYEIGLMAAASPEFAEAMIRALRAAGEAGTAPDSFTEASVTPAAA